MPGFGVSPKTLFSLFLRAACGGAQRKKKNQGTPLDPGQGRPPLTTPLERWIGIRNIWSKSLLRVMLRRLRRRNTKEKRYLPRSLALQVLEDARGPHPAADTHGHHTVVGFAPLHLMHELDSELGARGSHRVTKGDGPAIDVHLLRV